MIAAILYLWIWVFFLSPLVAAGFLIAYLCLYISARRKNARCPGAVPKETVDSRKKYLVISAVVTVVLFAVYWGILWLFGMSLMYM